MKLTTTLFSIAFIALFSGLCVAQAAFVDGVQLTTIKAPWTLRILGNDLDLTKVQAKPDEQSAYFMMVSESTNFNVSVFIEPVDKCKTGEECRDYVLGLGNPGWGKFQNLTKSKIKDFSYFEFYRPEVDGRPLKMLDMYAEYVSQGYWVDVHISKVQYSKGDHALFENVINSISFIPKGAAAGGTAFDAEIESGEKISTPWLGMWNGGKCLESYTPLSPISKQETSETFWVNYCQKVNSTFGELRSRRLIAAAFTRSLPPKTDRPLGILAYHTDYSNRKAVVEIIGLLLEKDGNWIMTNYLPQ